MSMAASSSGMYSSSRVTRARKRSVGPAIGAGQATGPIQPTDRAAGWCGSVRIGNASRPARVGQSMTLSASLAVRAHVPGSVTAGLSDLDGIPVVLARTDPGRKMGAMNAADGATLAETAELARQAQVPFIGVLATSGAEIDDGVPALHGWGLAAKALARCSGLVPVVLIVTGAAVSGPALLLGMADVVIMTDDAYAFMSGPMNVERMTGVRMSVAELGGPGPHSRASGVATLTAPDEEAALQLASAVLAHLPSHADEPLPRIAGSDPPDRLTPELFDVVPAAATGSYDVRDVVRSIVDDGSFLELWARWAPNMVTVLTVLDGRPIGVVANQPMALAGTLDIAASQKGARFVRFCDAFGLPVVTLVDTPGYFPGKDLEWRGIIRKGAQLAFAYAEANVPRVCVILRKAYGGAYIVMDSKRMGNDICLAWPTAEVAVMGAQQAVQILHRRLDADAQAERQLEYEETLLNPYVAAERGYVDAVIDPAETRSMVAAALSQLADKRERFPGRKHSNIPL